MFSVIGLVAWAIIGLPLVQSLQGKWNSTFLDHAPDWFVALFTGLLVYVTYRLVVSSNRLWKATKDAAERQVKDTEILQRAYLSVVPFGIEPFKSADGRLSCDVGFHNTGHLPARSVRWFIDRKFSTCAKDADFPIPLDEKQWHGNNIVAPGTSMRKGGVAINSAELDEFRAHNKIGDKCWLYVWGRVWYVDGFSKPRFTSFCHRYNLLGSRSWTLPESSARYHEHGNHTDEEALDLVSDP